MNDRQRGSLTSYKGIFFFTVAYWLFAILIQYLIPLECLDKPCNSEGIDNTSIGWASDFYISICMFAMGMHLFLNSKEKKQSTRFASLSLFSAGSAYLLGGLTHIYYPNNGTGDGYGMQEFYWMWSIGYTLLTVSCIYLYLFARSLSIGNGREKSSILQGFLTSTATATTLSCLLIIAGCFRCLFSADVTFTNSIIDQIPNLGISPTCTNLIFYGEGLWMILYSTFSIPWGLIVFRECKEFKNRSHTNRTKSWWLGLNPAIAGLMCPFLLWTIGYMYIAWVQLVLVLTNHPNIALLYKKMHGAEIHHFGVALFFFLTYSIAWHFQSMRSSVKNIKDRTQENLDKAS